MRLTLLLLGLAACGVDERDYTLRRATAECRTIESCDQGYYESEYRNHEDCIDEREDRLEDRIDDWFDGCAYDPQEAARCLSRVRGLSCAEWADNDADRACDLVYDCTR